MDGCSENSVKLISDESNTFIQVTAGTNSSEFVYSSIASSAI